MWLSWQSSSETYGKWTSQGNRCACQTYEWLNYQSNGPKNNELERQGMGKYQLDDKGRAQVTRYHEKHSKGGVSKKERLLNLREQFLNKNKKK